MPILIAKEHVRLVYILRVISLMRTDLLCFISFLGLGMLQERNIKDSSRDKLTFVL